MRSVFRGVGAVVVGFIGAATVIMIVEALNGRVFYPALGTAAEGVTDRDTVRGLLAAAPLGALLVVIGGWALGSFLGGWATARLAARPRRGMAWRSVCC